MFRSCESSKAHSGSDYSTADSDIAFPRNADHDANERNNVVGISRLLAVMLENDALENSKVAS